MIFAGVRYHVKTDIKFLSGRIDSKKKYIKVIGEQLNKRTINILCII